MKYLFILFTCLCFFCCDVPGVIKIKNKTSEDIEIKMTLENKNNKNFFIQKVKVKSGESGNIRFGYGTRWTKEVTTRYANTIDTIYLKVGDTQFHCSNINCMKEIFNLGKIRKFKRELKIVVNSKLIEKLFERE